MNSNSVDVVLCCVVLFVHVFIHEICIVNFWC